MFTCPPVQTSMPGPAFTSNFAVQSCALVLEMKIKSKPTANTTIDKVVFTVQFFFEFGLGNMYATDFFGNENSRNEGQQSRCPSMGKRIYL
jgi:hypothetical protein